MFKQNIQSFATCGVLSECDGVTGLSNQHYFKRGQECISRGFPVGMGEDAGEKKIDPKAGGRRKPFHHRRNANSNQPKTEKYEAPTDGLQHLV